MGGARLEQKPDLAAAKSRQGAERGGRRGGEVHGVSEPFRQRIIGNGGGKMRKTKKKNQDVTPVTSFTEMNTQKEVVRSPPAGWRSL